MRRSAYDRRALRRQASRTIFAYILSANEFDKKVSALGIFGPIAMRIDQLNRMLGSHVPFVGATLTDERPWAVAASVAPCLTRQVSHPSLVGISPGTAKIGDSGHPPDRGPASYCHRSTKREKIAQAPRQAATSLHKTESSHKWHSMERRIRVRIRGNGCEHDPFPTWTTERAQTANIA